MSYIISKSQKKIPATCFCNPDYSYYYLDGWGIDKCGIPTGKWSDVPRLYKKGTVKIFKKEYFLKFYFILKRLKGGKQF